MLLAVRIFVLVFAASLIALGAIWTRWYWSLRAREVVDSDDRIVVASRAVCLTGAGVFFGLAAILRSQWSGWVGIAFVVGWSASAFWVARRDGRRERSVSADR